MTGLNPTLLAAASDTAERYDALVTFIHVLVVFFFVLVIGATLYFMVKYRKRSDDQRTSPVKHNFKLEFAWSAIPTVLLIVMFAWGFNDFTAMSQTPADALPVRVIAKQWNWTISYPGLDRECTAEMSEDGGAETEFVLPVDQPFTVKLSSEDVLHSFWIPEFKVKKDALPNRYTGFTVTPTEVGRYRFYCAEYCGANHSRMAGYVNVVSKEDWKKWLAGELEGMPSCKVDPNAPDYAPKLFVKHGCAGCHSVTEDRAVLIGPPLYGLDTQGTETLEDGSTVATDDNYIRESIEYAEKKRVAGYAGKNMPVFRGRLSEVELDALVNYIKGLDDAPTAEDGAAPTDGDKAPTDGDKAPTDGDKAPTDGDDAPTNDGTDSE